MMAEVDHRFMQLGFLAIRKIDHLQPPPAQCATSTRPFLC
jgi:hypothetical protein